MIANARSRRYNLTGGQITELDTCAAATRTSRLKQNIIALLLRKGFGAGISYLLVPIVLDYLDPVRYGVWITMTSAVSWLYLFDVGLGNGMQNMVASALAHADKISAKIYISTSYIVVTVIAVLLSAILLFVYPLINWGTIFNTPQTIIEDVTLAVAITVFFLLCQLVARLIGSILRADEMPALAGYFNTAGSVMTLVCVLVAKRYYPGSISLLTAISGISNLVPFVIGSVVLFSTKYTEIKPSFECFKSDRVGPLLSLSGKFLVLQLSAVVIFSTDSMIISQLFSPAEVAPYAISNKYIGVVMIFFGIVLQPFWASFTHAHELRETDWIKRMVGGLLKLWGFVLLLIVVLVLISPIVYRLWLGSQLRIPFMLTLLMGVHFAILAFSQVFSKYINGVGKLRVQTIYAVVSGIVNIPLSVFLASTCSLGVNGVILATIISTAPVLYLAPYQYWQLLNSRARGIWDQ